MAASEVILKSSSEPREFEFTRDDFEQVRKLIYQHAGISLSPSKHEMVYSRLARRLRANNLNNFGEYLSMLRNNDEEEWQAFTNALTTNLTAFFREEHHFPLLAQLVKAQRERYPNTPLTLWCSASSTGEEPYSMAITMMETFNSLTPPVSIVATDVDTNVLSKGEQGVYTIDRLEKMSQERLRKYFLRGKGGNDGSARVREALRNMITFQQLNLLDDKWPISGPFDAIFCRNVMIYFDKETQYQILKKFVPLMKPDALMFAGHSESFHHAADLFKLRGKTVYEPIFNQSGNASRKSHD